MRAINAVLTFAVFVLAATASASALAWHHGGHTRFGVFIGGPGYWYPPYYYPPYYSGYAYPPMVIESSPPVYIEQGDGSRAAAPSQSSSQPQSATPSSSPSDWWYYCPEAKAYYPYVRECPAGWQRVAPQPQQ